jgi:diguanylate cyclase (GGDEF)-like protein
LPSDAELESQLTRSSTPQQIGELSELSRRLALSGRAAIALKLAQWAVEHAKSHDDAGLCVVALQARAKVQGELGDHAAGARSLLEAQSLNLDAGDARQELLIVTALGIAFGKLGTRTQAVAAHEAALSLAALCAPERMCECYGNLGLALANAVRDTEAIGFLRQAVTLAERGPDLTQQLRARINLNAVRAKVAEEWLKRGDAGSARVELREILSDCEAVLADCRAAQADQFVPPVVQHIGIVHKCLGEAPLARARFAYVTAMAREHGWTRLEYDVLLHLGAMETDAGNFTAAEEALAGALGYFERAGYKKSALEAHLELARLYERKGEFDRALAAMKKHHQVQLEIAANEERMTAQVRAWRVEFDGRLRRVRQSLQAASSTLDSAGQSASSDTPAPQGSAGAQGTPDPQVRIDPLTGLGNRHHGNAYLAQQFRLHGATSRTLAVALLRLDNLEAINNRYSHVVGDIVLTQVAALLRGTCRDSDLAVRFGGGEFLLVFPNTAADKARVICERLQARISTHDWRSSAPDLDDVAVTIAVADSRGAHSPLDLLRAAEARLHGEQDARRSRIA